MPAPLAKGIIITLSLIAALGIAILENPQVKDWIEEQRRKIAEALRSLGDELDPQSRRQAEAFAYEGRLPGETAAIANAVAVATGRDTEGDAVTRRMSTRSTQDPIDVSERMRLGREYLARRNQEMLDRQKKNGVTPIESQEKDLMTGDMSESDSSAERRASAASFDHLVNSDGTLRLEDKDFPAPPTAEPGNTVSLVPEMIGIANAPQLISTSAGARGMQAGSRYANPFGDEFEMSDPMLLDRSITPKPPVPPKVELEKAPSTSVAEVPGAFPTHIGPDAAEEDLEQLSFDEQLARALSLSLAENEERSKALRQQEEEQDSEMVRAIMASHYQAESGRVKEEKAAMSQKESSFVGRPIAFSGNHPLAPEPTHRDRQPHPIYPPPAQRDNEWRFNEEALYTVSPELTHATPASITPHDSDENEAAVSQPLQTGSVQQANKSQAVRDYEMQLGLLEQQNMQKLSFEQQEHDDVYAEPAEPRASTPDPKRNNAEKHSLEDFELQLMLLEQQNKKRLLLAQQERNSIHGEPARPSLGTMMPERNKEENHALQDYQLQLMLLEQQNKKRLLQARQAFGVVPSESMASGPTMSEAAMSSQIREASFEQRTKQPERLIDVDEPELATRTSNTMSGERETDSESAGFTTDSEADDFASLPGSEERSESRAASQSAGSLIEVEDVDMESMDSDDDDGIRTPGSWTDVGSDVGESDRSESDVGDVIRL